MILFQWSTRDTPPTASADIADLTLREVSETSTDVLADAADVDFAVTAKWSDVVAVVSERAVSVERLVLDCPEAYRSGLTLWAFAVDREALVTAATCTAKVLYARGVVLCNLDLGGSVQWAHESAWAIAGVGERGRLRLKHALDAVLRERERRILGEDE